jgi:hypothetical protein
VGGVAGQFFDNNGNPLSGGKIFTYAAGTTTNQVTYTSATGVTAHSNPIILDAAGRVPGGEIWLTDGLQYKFVIKTSTDVLIGTYDNIIGINSNFINFLTETEIQTATAGQTVFTLTTTEYQPGTNTLSVFVDGVNQYDGVSYSYVETNSTTVTFTAGLHVGALVKFTTAQTLSSGVTDASLVTFTGFNNQVGVVQELADDDGSDWIGFEPAGTGAVAMSVQAKLRESVSVKDFGAVGNGVTDDSAAIQAALDSGALSVFVPKGIYIVSSTLLLKTRGQRLYGEGGNYYFGSSPQYIGSILKYTGSPDIVLKCSPVISSGVPLIAASVENISIDGNGIATIGLYIEAAIQCVFNAVSVRRCSIAAIKTGSIPYGLGFTGLNYVHSCTFSNLWLDQYLTGDGDGLLLDGDVDSTTTVCNFSSVYVHHKNGNGITLKIADSNLFQGVYVGRGALDTGIGVELKGTTVLGKAVNSNTFIELVAGIGGVVSRAGAAPGFNAVGNVIYGLGMDTANPLPVIENGSSLFYQINFDANNNENTGGTNLIKLIPSGGSGTLLTFGGAGTCTYGFDFNNGNFGAGMMRYKNNTAIRARNAANTADIEVGRVNTINEWRQALTMRMADGADILPGSIAGTKIANDPTQKLGFWGVTPVVRPANIPNTSGATLGQLETEVNAIKQLLRNIGLMGS